MAGLAASWGVVAVLVSWVELGSAALAFARLALGALTLAAVALLTGNRRALSPRRPARRAGAARRRAGCPLAALLRGGQARLGGARGDHLLCGAADDRARRAGGARGARSTASPWRRSCPAWPASSWSRSPATAAARSRSRRSRRGSARRRRSPRSCSRAGGSCLRRTPPLTVAFWDCLVGTVVVAPFLLTGDRVLPAAAGSGGGARARGRFTGLSTLRHIWLLRRVTAQTSGVLTFLEPVVAVVLAAARPRRARHRRPRSAGGVLVCARGARGRPAVSCDDTADPGVGSGPDVRPPQQPSRPQPRARARPRHRGRRHGRGPLDRPRRQERSRQGRRRHDAADDQHRRACAAWS